MQGLVVVGLIFEEISNINLKCVKDTGVQNIGQGHRSRYLPSQYIKKEHYTRFGGWRPYSWGHMEGRRKRCKRQWSAKYRKVTELSYLQSLNIVEKLYARFGGCRPYSWGDIECQRKMCKRHWSAKYRSKSPGQDTCWVSTYRRSIMQGLVVRGLTLEEIWNVDINYVKVTAAKYRSRSPGQGICRVSTLRRSFCKVWWL